MTFPLSVKLKIRLSLWSITLLLLVLVGTSASLWFRQEQSGRLDDFLLREGRSVKDLLEGYFSFNSGEGPNYDSVTNKAFLSFTGQYFQQRGNLPLPYKTTLGVFDIHGRPILVTNTALDLAVAEPLALGDTQVVSVSNRQAYRLVFLPLTHKGQVLGTVRIACLTVTLGDNFESFLLSLASVLALAFVSFGALGTFLIGWSLRPVRQMSISAAEISDSHLDLRLAVPPGNDELSQMAETLNKLMARLERDFQFEEALVGQLSHELRTPLTVLRARNELALEEKASRAESYRVLEDNLADIDHVVSLLNTMLNLARLDSGLDRPPLKPCDLKLLLQELIAELEPLWDAKELGFELGLPDNMTRWDQCPPLKAKGDRFLLRQVFLNILTNAFKYAPRGSVIHLSVSESGTEDAPLWMVCIRNDGPSIPEESLELIFKRFYRVESQDPDGIEKISGLGQKGFGLGLSLAKAMLNLQDGHIRAYNPARGGAAFEVLIHQLKEPRRRVPRQTITIID